MKKKTLSHVGLVGSLVLAGLLVVFSTFVIILGGHVGVASLFGNVQPQPLCEGLNIVNPLLYVTPMSTQVQKYQEKHDAVTKDLQALHEVWRSTVIWCYARSPVA